MRLVGVQCTLIYVLLPFEFWFPGVGFIFKLFELILLFFRFLKYFEVEKTGPGQGPARDRPRASKGSGQGPAKGQAKCQDKGPSMHVDLVQARMGILRGLWTPYQVKLKISVRSTTLGRSHGRTPFPQDRLWRNSEFYMILFENYICWRDVFNPGNRKGFPVGQEAAYEQNTMFLIFSISSFPYL